MEIAVDSGNGVLKYEVEATRAGRRVEVTTSRGTIQVNEVTRTGTPVITARFMASRAVAIVDIPRRRLSGRIVVARARTKFLCSHVHRRAGPERRLTLAVPLVCDLRFRG